MRSRSVILTLAAAVGLGGCAYGYGDYGYGDYGYGYRSSYYSPYSYGYSPYYSGYYSPYSYSSYYRPYSSYGYRTYSYSRPVYVRSSSTQRVIVTDRYGRQRVVTRRIRR